MRTPPAVTALVLVACSGSAADTRRPGPPATERPAADRAGSYVAKRTIRVPCDDAEGCELEVEERLTISEPGDRGLPVEIELTRADASRCALSRTLVWTGDRWESRAGECAIALADLRLSVQGCREPCGEPLSVELTFARAPAETAAPVDCDELCTEIGACWEEVHDGEYRGGGECASRCEALSAADRRSFGTCVSAAGTCQETLACDAP